MADTVTLSGRDLIAFDEEEAPDPPYPFAQRQVSPWVGIFEATEVDVASRWLPTVLQTLTQMRWLPERWESSGALPPNETAIHLATDVLVALSEFDFPPDDIDPSTDEGVCISFRRGKLYADIECFNTGEILAALATDGEEPLILEVLRSEIEAITARITGFISG